MSELAEPVRLLLAYGVLPLWLAAGLADWACHRAGDMGHTAGVRESLLHWLMFGLMGAALLAVLLLEINAGVLLLALGLWLVHQAVTWLELRYVLSRRQVGPLEQMVHSAMEWLPLLGLALLALLYLHRWMEVPEGASVEWALRWRRDEEDPVRADWRVAPVLLAVLLVNGLPLAEELLRSWRQRPRRA
jgi:hypothetical protein